MKKGSKKPGAFRIYLTIRCSEQWKDKLQIKCFKNKISISKYIRNLVLADNKEER